MRTQTIQTFLLNTTSDLKSLYTPNMECQVNVAGDGGKPITGKFRGKSWRGFSDGLTTWKSFRIPWNADGEPQYDDSELKFSLEEHGEAIGLTGWDWMNRCSNYVGFDIDSVVGHKAGLDEDDLADIESKCSQLPWANLYRSTGGRGLHLYIHFETPVPTRTHSEHAALARSLLGILTVKTGIDFHDKTDCVGSVLWIWHRKIEGTRGLQAIYRGEAKFPNSLIPENWEDHVPVTKKLQKRTKIIDPAIEKIYAGIKNAILTPKHRKLLNYLDTRAKKIFWWDIDWGLLVCHTSDLRAAHIYLKLDGLFETDTSGSTPHNCYCYPTDNGGWVVRRFGQNVNEHISWIKDEGGWTKCYYNMTPSFEQAMKFFGGKEGTSKWFVFDGKTAAQQAFESIKLNFRFNDLPEQQIRVKKIEDKVHIKLPKDLGESVYLDSEGIKHFISEKGHYLRVIHMGIEEIQQNETSLPDSIVRAVIVGNTSAGWYIDVNGTWIQHLEQQVKTVLTTVYPFKKSKDIIMDIGHSLLNPWTLVNKPFKPEYTGEREWNRDGAQFPFAPVQGAYPYWEKVFSHLGKDLDESVRSNLWCKMHAISNGSDYLFYWVASMFQRPELSLPYLALVSNEQNTGKSTFHQGLRHFFKNDIGYIRANNALSNTAGFNGELHGGILAIAEEIDLRKTAAYNRIKDWVTGKTLLITDKFRTSFEAKNTLHFIHCMNDGSYCPIFPGDTRITMINVSPLTHIDNDGTMIDDEIPENIMDENLKKEAPFLLHDLLNVELPQPEGRLGVPVIQTYKKDAFTQVNKTPIQLFIDEQLFVVNGISTDWKQIANAFNAYLNSSKFPDAVKNKYTKNYINSVFPITDAMPKGKHGSKHTVKVGNISLFEDDDKDRYTGIFVQAKGGRIKLVSKKDRSRTIMNEENISRIMNEERENNG